MRTYDLLLGDGRRIRIVRQDRRGTVHLEARAFDMPHRPTVGRAELRLPVAGGLLGQVAVTVDPAYQRSGLDYRLGALLLLVGREAGLERLVSAAPVGDEASIDLLLRLGADSARREGETILHEIPVPRKRAPGRSGSWMLRDLHFRS